MMGQNDSFGELKSLGATNFMGIKEQVKSGALTPQEALTKVSRTSDTYGWLKRRISGNYPRTESKPAKLKKYKSKKVAQPEN